jgi:hypothetical protein
MRPHLERAYPLLTSRKGVEFVRNKTGAPLTLSRFHKDRMRGVAPKPVATFGNRDLFTEAQMLEYGRSLIKPVQPHQQPPRLGNSQLGSIAARPLLPRKTYRRIGHARHR